MQTTRIFQAASLSAASLLASTLAQAGGHGWYVGAAYSDVSGHYEATPMPTEPVVVPFAGFPANFLSNDLLKPLGSQGYKLLAGYRPRDWLAFEANFTRFDGASRNLELICVTTPCPGELRSDAGMAAISVLGFYPLGPVDLMVRAGFAHWDAGVDVLDTVGTRYLRTSSNGTDVSFGGGVQYQMRQVSARLEYERLNFGRDTADSYSIGISYSFH